MTDCPWLVVSGFGSHIKSTQKTLIIQKKNGVEEYPLASVKNLLIIGGHTVHSVTISHLIRNGTFISFFESDSTPVGIIRPFGIPYDSEIQKSQLDVSRHRYAIEIARGSLKSRLIMISKIQQALDTSLFYEGEMEFLQKSLDELGFLIKLDEIKRLNRMATDIYYEILSREVPPEFGYKRRTPKPQMDPVNAMLSFGYSMLYGNCCASVVGARLDPDVGIIHEGNGSLVLDLIEPLKAEMVDTVVLLVAKESLKPSDYELTNTRCILSDAFVKHLITLFHNSIDGQKINNQVMNFKETLTKSAEFRIQY